MITIPGVPPVLMWAGFLLIIIILLIIDLGLFNKKVHTLSVKEALVWTFIWFSLAMVFNWFLWFEFGKEIGLQFFTGYLIEKALSVDNLFVILLIFSSFRIDPKYQHRVLFWGIVGALVMRGIMIIAGAALVTRFEWILYIFGAFLVYSGIKIFAEKEKDFDPHDNIIVRWIKKLVHVTKHHYEGKFVVKENGKLAVTLLFVALIVIEFTDVMFAFDSIPAIFGITKDPFIVFTSNIFAILGLRSLYFVILKAHHFFQYLNYGLGIILVFIGVKMLIEHWIHIPIGLSLGIIAGILVIFMSLSWVIPDGKKKKTNEFS